MTLSNKKKKQITRLYPTKTVKEIASELDLKEREVEAAIRALGLGKKPAASAGPQLRTRPGTPSNLIIALVIAVMAAAAYAQSLGYGFVADDKFLILENPLVTGKTQLGKIFSVRYFEYYRNKGVYYRPVATLSYWLNYRVGKTNPTNYHLLNLVLHLAASVLAFYVFGKWAGSREAGAITGVLFALHPAHTQSVSWIAGRCDLLVTVPGLLMLWLFLLSRDREELVDWKLLAGSNIAFGLALFSKELAMILPVLILAADLLRPASGRFRPDRSRLVFYGSLAVPAAIYLYARYQVLGVPFGYTIQPDYQWYALGGQDVSRAAMVFKIYFYYLQTLFYPINLCFECKLDPSFSWLEPWLLVSIIGVLAAIELAWISARRLPEITLGIICFFLGLVLVANIIPIQEIAMEQFLYLPSLGFCLALAGVLAKLCAAERPRTKQAAVAIMVIISGLYLTLTLARNPVWKNNLTLFSDAVQNAPRKSRAQGSLGQTLSEIGKLPAAVRAYRMALQSEPDSASAHYNLANSYFNLKQLPLAIAEYREAVRYDPKHIKARNNLGYALEKSGDLQAAAEAYKGALSLNAGFYPSLAGLFRVDMSLGRCDEAWNLRNRLGAEAPGDLVKQLPQVCPR